MKTRLPVCYKCVGVLGPAPMCSLFGGSVFVSPHGPRLIVWCPRPLWLPQSYLPLFHKTPQILSNVWRWYSASVSISCWRSLSEDSYARLLCNHSRVSFIVSGVDSLLWDRSQVGQSLVGHLPNQHSSFTFALLTGRPNFMLKVLWVGCGPPLYWMSCLATGGGHFQSPYS